MTWLIRVELLKLRTMRLTCGVLAVEAGITAIFAVLNATRGTPILLAATTRAGARIGYSMFQSGDGAPAGTPLPFGAAVALLAGLAVLFCAVAARTTVARDVS